MASEDDHVYMSRITQESIDLTEDSNLQPSPVAQTSQETPNLFLLPSSTINCIWYLLPSGKVCYQYKLHLQTTYLSGHFVRMMTGILSQVMHALAFVNGVSNFHTMILLLMYPLSTQTMMRIRNITLIGHSYNNFMMSTRTMRMIHISMQLKY